MRNDFANAGATIVATPADAQPSGFELPAGPILTAPTDPEAVFVDLWAGMAERWLGAEEPGCD